MEIIQIDTTPNPDAIKFTLDFDKEGSRSSTYNMVHDENPEFANDLLAVDGVRSVFHALNFITVDKEPDADWDLLMPIIKDILSK